MIFLRRLLIVGCLALVIGSTGIVSASPYTDAMLERAKSCPITQPNGNDPEGSGNVDGFGNDALWTNVEMWSFDGTVPVDLGHILPSGELGQMKWAWFRYVPGKLTIEGRRLDAPALPLRAEIPDGYGMTGFQVSGLIFPTGGCWEVIGRVGNESLTFVTFVIPPFNWVPQLNFWQ
jgi:hypothetical protein